MDAKNDKIINNISAAEINFEIENKGEPVKNLLIEFVSNRKIIASKRIDIDANQKIKIEDLFNALTLNAGLATECSEYPLALDYPDCSSTQHYYIGQVPVGGWGTLFPKSDVALYASKNMGITKKIYAFPEKQDFMNGKVLVIADKEKNAILSGVVAYDSFGFYVKQNNFFRGEKILFDKGVSFK